MRMKFPGADLADYRDQTARHASMSGVTSPSFICKQCQQSRRTAGRKRVPMGWVCAKCNDQKEAA